MRFDCVTRHDQQKHQNRSPKNSHVRYSNSSFSKSALFCPYYYVERAVRDPALLLLLAQVRLSIDSNVSAALFRIDAQSFALLLSPVVRMLDFFV